MEPARNLFTSIGDSMDNARSLLEPISKSSLAVFQFLDNHRHKERLESLLPDLDPQSTTHFKPLAAIAATVQSLRVQSHADVIRELLLDANSPTDRSLPRREGTNSRKISKPTRKSPITITLPSLSQSLSAVQKQLSKLDEKSMKTFNHLFSGAMAAVVARTTVAPLERLKLEYMVCGAKASVPRVVSKIFKAEGVPGFWMGNTVNLIRIVPFKSINFFAFDIFRKRLMEFSKRTEANNTDRLVAGAAAGFVATVICFPVDTVRTRMVAYGGAACTNLTGCLTEVVAQEGVMSLYRGLLPALLSMGPAGAVFYGSYDLMKTAHLNGVKRKLAAANKNSGVVGGPSAAPQTTADGSGESAVARPRTASMADARRTAPASDVTMAPAKQLELGPSRTLLYGALAGAASELATYPLEVVRRQLQLQAQGQARGLFGTIQGIVQKEGVRGLYAGVVPSTLQVLPSAAISYFVYEFLKLHLKVD